MIRPFFASRIFKPYYYFETGCAAYLFGCGGLGKCAVVDAMLRAARDRADSRGLSLELAEGRVESLPLEDDAFDVVFAVTILQRTLRRSSQRAKCRRPESQPTTGHERFGAGAKRFVCSSAVFVRKGRDPLCDARSKLREDPPILLDGFKLERERHSFDGNLHESAGT